MFASLCSNRGEETPTHIDAVPYSQHQSHECQAQQHIFECENHQHDNHHQQQKQSGRPPLPPPQQQLMPKTPLPAPSVELPRDGAMVLSCSPPSLEKPQAHFMAEWVALLVLCTLTGVSLAYVVLDARSGAQVCGAGTDLVTLSVQCANQRSLAFVVLDAQSGAQVEQSIPMQAL